MLIIITLPHFFEGEAEKIASFLENGTADLIHIRKPEAGEEAVEQLIRLIPEQFHSRLVLHDYHHLAMKYSLYGIHLNGRNPVAPDDWTGSVSRSCHSLAEVKEWKGRCNYVSLSPIFDSISKKGYMSAFSEEEIRQACEDGVIDEKVVALGGVTFNNINKVKEMGFGGAMILGDAWR